MKRHIKILLFVLTFAVVGVEAILAINPAARTAAYVAVYRATGPRGLPVDPCRLVPIWDDIEPGIRMRLDPCDQVSRAILINHVWEPSTTKELMSHLHPGATFVDVGAHVGWYTLKAAKAVGPRGKVIAVEPNPETLIHLRDNLWASHATSNVVVAPVASSESEATLTLYAAFRGNTGESSLSRSNASQAQPISGSYSVRARRLDDIVKDAGVSHVDVIKIDVEGAEFLVLKGAACVLDRDHPVLSVELVENQLQSMGTSEAEVTAFLAAHGYRASGTHEANTVFVPSGKALRVTPAKNRLRPQA